MEGYKTVHRAGVGEITEKKSRFIAHVFHVESEDEALFQIEALKKEYWDARHNCYAYTVGVTNPTERYSDDREPAGTAGRPILDVIRGEELKDTLIVVTRYFGGVLLGTGGLVRAYQASARAGLEASVIARRIPALKVLVTTDYSGLGKLQYLAAKLSVPVISVDYADSVKATILCDEAKLGDISRQMQEVTSGATMFDRISEVIYTEADGEVTLC
ncbi:MAG: YigZ family protein [Lachnospiraceae bacterium]|nr:YigZ family protein [Lachnospiraceae bacterium]